MNPDNDSRKKLFQGVVVGVLWAFVSRSLDIAAPRGMKILLSDPNGPFDVTTLTMKLLLVDDENVVRETRANALTAEEGIDLVMVATHSVADLTRLAVRSGLIEM